jgi:hypothetical protein
MKVQGKWARAIAVYKYSTCTLRKDIKNKNKN